MGIFSRLTDIVNANIVTMLDKAEDPEKMIRLMISEMEETLVEVKSNAAKIISDKKTVERIIQTAEKEKMEWIRRAELAVMKSRDDLAKLALEEKARLEDTIETYKKELMALDYSLDQLYLDIDKLEAKLNDAQKRKKSIVARKNSLSSQRDIRNQLSKAASYKMVEKFDSWERSIDRLEGEVEVMQPTISSSTEEMFYKLENEKKISEELDYIKQKLNGSFKSEAKNNANEKSEKIETKK